MLAAAAGAVSLTGCGQLINPYTTELHYDAADGVSAHVGDLSVQDALIINDGKGGEGKMSGLVYNSGSQDRQLTISVNGSDAQVTVPAGNSVRLDGKANGNGSKTVDAVSISSLGDAKVGNQIPVSFTTSPGGSSRVSVPVVLDQPPYGNAKEEHAEDVEPQEGHDVGLSESEEPKLAPVEKGTSVTGG